MLYVIHVDLTKFAIYITFVNVVNSSHFRKTLKPGSIRKIDINQFRADNFLQSPSRLDVAFQLSIVLRIF